ncbi:choice-of-anchor D domain-containing protein [Amycolatopsis anabasis]|uniref:choice-of-anchor D domain-containing protein n=1 Tax=Amycolatopsis anabasis TaxID=1840409 RepID=UPI00131C822C|nr:choice-of-anchor D domain-containing protein [Amycolatopsis anabasis]
MAAALAVLAAAAIVVAGDGGERADAAAAPGTTVRASVQNGTNAQAQSGGRDSDLSANGTQVAFTSRSELADLPVFDAQQNVFVRDLVRDRTVQISRGQFVVPEPRPPVIHLRQAQPEKDVPPDGESSQPSISGDGRYVAFLTGARNIVENSYSSEIIVVCDRDPDGDADFDERIAPGRFDYRYHLVTLPAGESSAYPPRTVDLAADASRVVWQSKSDSGASYAMTAVLRVNGGPVGRPAVNTPVPRMSKGTIEARQFFPKVSGDGRQVLYAATFPNEADFSSALVVWNSTTNALYRVDAGADGKFLGDDPATALRYPALSHDGSAVAFVDRRDFYRPDVYLVRRDPNGPVGARLTSRVVSRDNAGNPVNGLHPALSGDGRYLAFVTDNPGAHDGIDRPPVQDTCIRPYSGGTSDGPVVRDQTPRDVRTPCQVVVRDLVVDEAQGARLPGALASPAQFPTCQPPPDGTCAGNADSTPRHNDGQLNLSGDGARVAYDSDASDLVPGDTNDAECCRVPDVFVRTFTPSPRVEPVEFGPVVLGGFAERTATLAHSGFGPLPVEQLAVGGVNSGEFVLGTQTCAGLTLYETGRCLAEIRFTPAGDGPRQAQLEVRLRGVPQPVVVPLRGAGERPPSPPPPDQPPPPPAPPGFAASPDPLEFGIRLPLSTAPDATLVVANTGGSPLTVTGAGVEAGAPGSAPGDFAVTGNGCAGVAPGATCAVTVRFTPGGPGDRAAVLVLTSNAPGGPHLVGLHGQQTVPAIQVNPGLTPPGRVTTVTGTGFPPSRAITVTMPGRPERATARTDAAGTFGTQLVILPKSAPGDRTVLAAVDGAPAVSDQEAFLVVFGTSGPPKFTERG